MKQKELERLRAQDIDVNMMEGARAHDQYYPS